VLLSPLIAFFPEELIVENQFDIMTLQITNRTSIPLRNSIPTLDKLGSIRWNILSRPE
jgi:hypothetical protein